MTVVSEALAREFWPGDDPLGKRIHLIGPDLPWMTVVGVVRDVRPEALSEPPRPTCYTLTAQFARMAGFADQGMNRGATHGWGSGDARQPGARG